MLASPRDFAFGVCVGAAALELIRRVLGSSASAADDFRDPPVRRLKHGKNVSEPPEIFW